MKKPYVKHAEQTLRDKLEEALAKMYRASIDQEEFDKAEDDAWEFEHRCNDAVAVLRSVYVPDEAKIKRALEILENS